MEMVKTTEEQVETSGGHIIVVSCFVNDLTDSNCEKQKYEDS